jgi:hypothetical protein
VFLGSFLSRSIGEHTLEKRQVKNILKRKKKKSKEADSLEFRQEL